MAEFDELCVILHCNTKQSEQIIYTMNKELTIEDIQEIVAKDESRYLELKQTTGELYKAMTSACAFLNTDGGWVMFGITPKLKIVGQNVTDPTRQEIANALRKFEPAIDVPVQYIEIPEKEGFYVIAMYFNPPAPTQAPYTFDARPYYKVENTTAIMPREMFEARIRRSNPGMFSWEKLKCQIPLEEIDRDRLYMVVQMGVNKGRIPGSALALQDTSALLTHFNLMDNDKDVFNAACVLFAKSPDKYHNQCKVRLGRFEGTTMSEFRDHTVCYGNLFEQYDAIINFCQKHMFLAARMDEVERVETLTVPFKVVREATLNTIIHRDWDAYNLTPSIAIFDDRVEFQNPGDFPLGSTYKDFIENPHSSPVNPKIADVFFKSGLMEAWGRGIANIFDECEKYGLPTPEFKVGHKIVTLVIRFKNSITPHRKDDGPVNGPVNGPINDLLEIIKNNPGIQKPAIKAHIGKGDTTIKRYLKQLVEQNLIEYKGSDKTGGYYPKE